MALAVSHDKALRGLPALESLVRAVVGAGAHDESDCVEWKGAIDLSTKAGCFLVAKAILGLANRNPARAARFFEGYGYVVAGAEPGSLPGVGTVDPADYATRVNGHIGGADGPAWTPVWLPVDGVDVLVVTVEPPQPGDHIWSLRREFSEKGTTARRGTIYVRKPGKSEPADDADIDMLQDRLLASEGPDAELRVEVVREPLRWLDRKAIETEARESADAVAGQLLQQAQDVPSQRDDTDDSEPQDNDQGFAGIDLDAALSKAKLEESAGLRVPGWGYTPDSRSFEEFRDELDSWKERWIDAVVAGAEQLAAASNPVVLRVSNPTDLFLPDVEVEIVFEFESGRGVEEIDTPHLPDLPRPFGQGTNRTLSSLFGGLKVRDPGLLGLHLPVTRRTWVRDGSVIIEQDCGDLRPHSVDEGDIDDTVFVLLTALPPGGVLAGRWSATVRDRNGVIQGAVDLAVRADPLSLDELLAVRDIEDE